jgi:hypothetical protein
MTGTSLTFALCMSCLLSAQPEPPEQPAQSEGQNSIYDEEYTIYLLDSRWEQEGTKLEDIEDFIEVEVDERRYLVDPNLIVSRGIDLDFFIDNIKDFVAPRSVGLNTPAERKAVRNAFHDYLPFPEESFKRAALSTKLRVRLESGNESWIQHISLSQLFPEMAGPISFGNMTQDHPLAAEFLAQALQSQEESSLDSESSAVVLAVQPWGQRLNLLWLDEPIAVKQALVLANEQVRKSFSKRAASRLGLEEYLNLSFAMSDNDPLCQRIFEYFERALNENGLYRSPYGGQHQLQDLKFTFDSVLLNISFSGDSPRHWMGTSIP